ncbi:hypothetical protein JTE90_008631 [Oedothorax gibbosus]|uniref:Reverse transcriptase domain-containing protein n=1 Tax=Oedothorax gibbosus TaxID=931172 RepID=A0AAV6TZ65_9ARAC|nr:hypothetical protein JTE90_008631 [Oedothorax gibbosus]
MTQGKLPKSPKPWWNHDCSRAEKQKKRAWGIFRRYPTEANLIEFKRARSQARRIRRESQRIWNEKVFPTSWQRAIVIPIAKPGKDPQDAGNYRPIALTSCLCKLMERMVNARLVYCLEEKGTFSPFQSGFRHHRSTIDNILLLETSIREAFVRNQHLVSIFFDMEKAYDRTWRYGILKDLYHLGFRGNLPVFIQNFLKTRVFQVRVGSTLSRDFYQREGVPQGSVLSVVLFILKINDIVKQLPLTVKGTLFVDDFQISCASANMSTIERQLQIAIRKITDWTNSNGFVISNQKTICMHFCRKRGLHPDPEITLNGVALPDAFEVVNPLGSAKRKQRLVYTLPYLISIHHVDNIQLLLLCREVDLKYLGMKNIFSTN